MLTRRHWIPPLALLYAQLAHGVSWAIAFWIAWSGNLGSPLAGFFWLHTIALGWVTMAALAILLFAIPQFTDTPWRGRTAARWALVVYGIGVAYLLYGFAANPPAIERASVVILLALIVYLFTAFSTIGAAMRGERIERTIARAFAIPLGFLTATVLAGIAMAPAAAGRIFAPWVPQLAPVHADIGTLGWLSILIFGMSARTFRPITGNGSRFRAIHIMVGSLSTLGAALLALGIGLHIRIVALAGGALFAIAALAYVFDGFDVLPRATVPHRPPQAFIGAALCWFLASMACGAGVLLGYPWQAAYAVMLLLGWIGQMVNAHIHHIGVRVIATVYRGDEDETPPEDLLEARLSWLSFAAFQCAIAVIVAAIFLDNMGMGGRGALIGFAAWIAMAANLGSARLRAAYAPAR